MVRVRWARLRNNRDTDPELVESTWHELVTWLTAVQETELPKDALPGWIPARVTGRGTARVQAVSLVVLDLDHPTPDAISALDSNLDGLAWAWHSTYSHTPDKPKLRVVVLPDREITPQEWPRVWSRIAALAGADPQCRDPGRLYYAPYRPRGAPYLAGACAGVPLPVDSLLASSPVHPTPASASTPTGVEALLLLRKRKARSGDIHTAAAAQSLGRLLSGEAYANPGERDNVLFQVACLLAEALPNADPRELAGHCRESIDAQIQRDGEGPSVDTFAEKIERKQRERRESDPNLIRLRQQGLDGGYTPDQLLGWAQEHGLESVAELRAQLIVQHHRDLYVFHNGTYRGPVPLSTAEKYLVDYLLPATYHGSVSLYQPNSRGELSPKTPTKLVEQYGRPIQTVVPSFVAQRSYIDRETDTLVQAVCPRRPLEPTWDPEVDRWLSEFAGPQYERLQDWLATATSLDRPSSALYLCGPKSTGKSLFAEALARIWTTYQATPLEALANSFNASIVRCPVVLADETLPDKYAGRWATTATLRELITSRDRLLTRKYSHDATLVGSLRIVIAANNLSLLCTTEHLTEADVDALCERLFYIQTRNTPLPPELGNSFRYDDRMARHVLYLARNRKVQPAGRLWVAGEDSPLHREIRISAGAKSQICHWLVEYLQHPQRCPSVAAEKGVVVRDGQVWVSAPSVYRHFKTLLQQERQPSARAVSEVLRELSYEKSRGLWHLSLEALLQWVESRNWGDRALIQKTIDEGIAGETNFALTN